MHRVQTSVNQRKRDRETQRVRAIDGALETLVHNVNGSNNSVQNVYPWFSQPSAVFEYKGSHTHTHTKWAQKECKKTRSREMHHTDSLTLHLAIAPVETIYPFWNTKYLLLLSQNDVFGWKIGVNCLQSLPLLCSLSLVSILFLSLNCHGFLCL